MNYYSPSKILLQILNSWHFVTCENKCQGTVWFRSIKVWPIKYGHHLEIYKYIRAKDYKPAIPFFIIQTCVSLYDIFDSLQISKFFKFQIFFWIYCLKYVLQIIRLRELLIERYRNFITNRRSQAVQNPGISFSFLIVQFGQTISLFVVCGIPYYLLIHMDF